MRVWDMARRVEALVGGTENTRRVLGMDATEEYDLNADEDRWSLEEDLAEAGMDEDILYDQE